MKIITQNKKAHLYYDILECYQAGIELKGSEVKSLRLGMVDIKHAYGRIENNEVFLYNFHISKYPFSHEKFDPKRPKKLLLHKREIHRLIGKIKEKSQTLIPLKLYFTDHGYAKVELALVKGKKLKDRREEIKKKIIDREIKEYLLR